MRRLSSLTPVAPIVLVAVLAIGAAACGSSSDDKADTGPTQPSSESPTTTAGGTTSGALELTVADSSLGSVVVDGEGRTLYVFTSDTGSESSCYGQCETAWPPLVGETTAGSGITGELGTTTRTDGTTQVTLGGHPLYRYASDVNPGDTSGQGVGGVWFVVDGAGDAVRGETSGVGGY
jgi:predicted lipoprotein with Yx(FWY)xxD motif